MSVFKESGIEFDFTRAQSVVKHDEAPRNTFWSGVDFCIEDSPDESIWLEVKSWNPARMEPKWRGGNQRRFVSEMKSAAFSLKMRSKFFGTSAFFGWQGDPLPETVRYILVFEPPRRIDSALTLAFSHKIKSQIAPPKSVAWRSRINVSVLGLSEWNQRFPDYPARIF